MNTTSTIHANAVPVYADVLEDHIRELADGPATPAPAAPVMVRSRAGRQRERRGRRVLRGRHRGHEHPVA